MRKICLLLFSTVIFVTGCSDETTFFDVDQQDLRTDYLLEENNTILSNGINNNSNGVLDIYFEHEISGKSQGVITNSIIGKTNDVTTNTTSDFHLNLIGQIERPVLDENSNLTATHVDYNDNFAYVSYNTVGEVFAGAVDVIDLSNPLLPVLASRMYMNNRDANIILYDNGYLYVLGSVDAEKVLEATGGSFIAKIGVFNGVIDLNDITHFYQEGNTATGIAKIANAFFVSSGVDGSIAKYDATTFLKSKEIAFDDLRSVASENGRLAVLDAGKGVTIFDSELNELSTINTSTSFIEDAKRTIAIKEDLLFVPEGEQGTGVYNLNTGALEERLSILIAPENITASDKVTNAVSVNGSSTLLANGGAGLALKVKNDLIDLTGVVELSGSINYVVSEGDYIFAASGRSGLQIINKIRSDESTVVPEGGYVIRARHSSRVMGLSSFSTNDGINISQESIDGQAENEKWSLEILDSGAYIIRSRYSNKVAQATSSGISNVEQSEYQGEANQQWAIEPAVDEGYFYIRNLSNNKYIDVSGRSNRVGGNLITWKFHGRENQQWKFEQIDQ